MLFGASDREEVANPIGAGATVDLRMRGVKPVLHAIRLWSARQSLATAGERRSAGEEGLGSQLYGGERECLRGENARRAQYYWALPGCTRLSEGKTFEAVIYRRSSVRNGREGTTPETESDLRAEQSPEGEKLRSVTGAK